MRFYRQHQDVLSGGELEPCGFVLLFLPLEVRGEERRSCTLAPLQQPQSVWMELGKINSSMPRVEAGWRSRWMGLPLEGGGWWFEMVALKRSLRMIGKSTRALLLLTSRFQKVASWNFTPEPVI